MSGRYIAVKAALLLATLLDSHLAFAQRPRGTAVLSTLTSPALQGNALGHSATRQARVYLPPSYFNTGNKRYPVLYYLHGAVGDENNFYSFSGSSTADRLIREGSIEEMIIVGVDASGGQPISSYVNSELNGNYDDYIVQDLVQHVDSVFRTIPDRDSRGVFGASMGGFGTYIYAMTHSDVFGAAYSMSSGFHGFSRPDGFPFLGEAVARPNLASQLSTIAGPGSIPATDAGLIYAWASAFSPNLDKPPFRVDLPFELPSMKVIPEIRDKWYAYDAFLLLDQHAEDLSSLRGFAFDVGNADSNLAANEAFHQSLLDRSIDHQFEVFSGGHSDKRDQRIGVALTFLSESQTVIGMASLASRTLTARRQRIAKSWRAPSLRKSAHFQVILMGTGACCSTTSSSFPRTLASLASTPMEISTSAAWSTSRTSSSYPRTLARPP